MLSPRNNTSLFFLLLADLVAMIEVEMALITKLRYGAEYFALRLVIGVVRLIPLDQAAGISASIWRKLAPLGKRRHQRALDNLAKAFPEKSQEERQQIALEAWANLGRVMVETMQLDRILRQPERIEILKPKVMERYRGKMGPLICCSLHSGNWELATWPLAVVDAQPAAVYRIVTNPYVDAYLRRQRKELYPGGMFARGGKTRGSNVGYQTARMLGSYARKGGRLGFLADAYDAKGIPVPFFGHDAPSNQFPAMLARRVGCRMWVGRCIRTGTLSRFQVEMKELKVPYSDDKDADVKEVTAAMQQQFEQWIREYPEQWMWSNRKWS